MVKYSPMVKKGREYLDTEKQPIAWVTVCTSRWENGRPVEGGCTYRQRFVVGNYPGSSDALGLALEAMSKHERDTTVVSKSAIGNLAGELINTPNVFNRVFDDLLIGDERIVSAEEVYTHHIVHPPIPIY